MGFYDEPDITTHNSQLQQFRLHEALVSVNASQRALLAFPSIQRVRDFYADVRVMVDETRTFIKKGTPIGLCTKCKKAEMEHINELGEIDKRWATVELLFNNGDIPANLAFLRLLTSKLIEVRNYVSDLLTIKSIFWRQSTTQRGLQALAERAREGTIKPRAPRPEDVLDLEGGEGE